MIRETSTKRRRFGTAGSHNLITVYFLNEKKYKAKNLYFYSRKIGAFILGLIGMHIKWARYLQQTNKDLHFKIYTGYLHGRYDLSKDL